jgi:hypothetical protein
LAESIAITGSVSMGICDRFSDLDISVWTSALDGVDQYTDWFTAAGAREDRFLREEHPGHRHFVYQYKGQVVEIDWLTWRAFDAILDAVNAMLAGRAAPSDERCLYPWMLTNAVVLRDGGLRERIQTYESYPAEFGERVISQQIHDWRMEAQFPLSKFSNVDVIARGEVPYVRQRQLSDLHAALRILFALNRRWMPVLKWAMFELRSLETRPARLPELIERIVAGKDIRDCASAHMDMIADVLKLMPSRPDAMALLNRITQFDLETAFANAGATSNIGPDDVDGSPVCLPS